MIYESIQNDKYNPASKELEIEGITSAFSITKRQKESRHEKYLQKFVGVFINVFMPT